jgi:capsular exopolysaccharide synthesis family protein
LELELRHLIGYAKRWWWLLLLMSLMGGGLAFFKNSRQPRFYSATATLLISPAPRRGTDELSAIQTGQSLAATYQQLVVTEPILEPVVQDLGLPFGVDLLKGKVSADTVRDTQLLHVSASDTEPARAAAIANAVADRFAKFISEQELARDSPARAALQKLIEDTQREADQTRQQIGNLEAKGHPNVGDQSQLEDLHARLDQLERSLADLLVQAQQLDLDAAALQNQVRVYVPATVPDAPIAPRTLFYTVLGAFLGGVVGLGVVGLIEYLDDTVKPGSDFGRLVGAPLLSVIGTVPKPRGGRSRLFVVEHSNAAPAEAIRLLRTNLDFAAATREISSLVVTSCGSGEGKSTVTANLGAAMAQAGLSVVIVDADLRHPSQHNIFGVGNERGLATLLTHPEQPWRWAAVDGPIDGLSVIPSGPLPLNPGDLIGLDRMRTLLAQVTQDVDVVLIDTPPILDVSDPLVIAFQADAVALVSRAARTRVDALQRAAALLRQGGIRNAGVVLNRQRGGGGGLYAYRGRDDGPDQPSGSRGFVGLRGRRPATGEQAAATALMEGSPAP